MNNIEPPQKCDRPVAVFRHYSTEGPGFLATHLEARGIDWTLIALDEDHPVPSDSRDYAGLVFMGGPMSVNDDLPWIPPVLELIRDADRHDVPVLGHCLGSQLMARAWGGVVTRQPAKEIGWGPVEVAQTALARRWFGSIQRFIGFHWHGETWSLPPEAELLASSAHCVHQGFARGPHLGLQFHVEMTQTLVRDWCAHGSAEIAAARTHPGVQEPSAILAALPGAIAPLNAVATQLYDVWCRAVISRYFSGS